MGSVPKMIGIDLFAGAGGMSLGAMMTGIDLRFAVESDLHAVATYAHNHPNVEIFSNDIRKLRTLPLEENRVPTILFGGPPCQGFSTSNQRTRNLENPANWLFKEFLRIARLSKPDWILFENVTGIRETAGGAILDQVISSLERMKYKVSSWVLNAEDFGVPQKRSRFFAIASRDGAIVPKPKPTHAQPVSVWSAIGDLPLLSNGASETVLPYKCSPLSEYARKLRGTRNVTSNNLVTRNAPLIIRRYEHIKPGGNWEDIPARLMRNYADRNRCHTGIYRRLEKEKPSIVIGNFRKNMLVHPVENRGLSVREAARLQSFPDSFEFKGSIGFQQQQVGNAVPPFLAKIVFKQIMSYGA